LVVVAAAAAAVVVKDFGVLFGQNDNAGQGLPMYLIIGAAAGVCGAVGLVAAVLTGSVLLIFWRRRKIRGQMSYVVGFDDIPVDSL